MEFCCIFSVDQSYYCLENCCLVLVFSFNSRLCGLVLSFVLRRILIFESISVPGFHLGLLFWASYFILLVGVAWPALGPYV